MPTFEKPINISSSPKYPSIGTLLIDIDVKEFINACSDEEFEHLVLEIRAIALQNDIIAAPPGLRQLSDEEVKSLGLPPLDINGNPLDPNLVHSKSPFVEDIFPTTTDSKPKNRKPINRVDKNKKK